MWDSVNSYTPQCLLEILYLNLTQQFEHPCVIGTNGVNLCYVLICAVTQKDSPPPKKKKYPAHLNW